MNKRTITLNRRPMAIYDAYNSISMTVFITPFSIYKKKKNPVVLSLVLDVSRSFHQNGWA